jgi:class 3 adenylate cyclase
MRCSNCGTEGLQGKRFCAECGSALPIRCSKCGAATPPRAKFCPDCGTAIGERSTSEASALVSSAAKAILIPPEQDDAAHSIDGERKTVTALFADIKGSMELMEDLDPEDAQLSIPRSS